MIKIDEAIDFSFVYEITKDYYSSVGRESIDPVVLFKLCLMKIKYIMLNVLLCNFMSVFATSLW